MAIRDNPLADDGMKELRRFQLSSSGNRSLATLLLSPKPILDLLPMHSYPLRCIDSHPDDSPSYAEDHNRNLVANHYGLAYLTCQHKHNSILP
jgi:hypothetical protein